MTTSPRRRRLPLVLGGVVIAAAAVIAVVAWPHGGDVHTAAAPPAPDAAVRVPDPVPVPPPPPSTVMLTITSTPPGARVLSPKDRTPLGVTPFNQEVDRGTGTKEFIVELDGYLAKDVSLPTDETNAIEVPLVRVPTATAPAPKPTRPKPPKSGTPRQKGTPVNPFGN